MRAFYNAKPDLSGCGCGFSFNSKDEAIYASFVRQSQWNAAKKTGIFNGEKINLKFSPSEAGQIIYAIERMETWTAFHDTSKGNYADKYTTQITFGPFGETGKERFGFSVKKKEKETNKETKFSIALSKGDAIVIRAYLEFAMEHINSADYAEDKKKRSEALKSRDKDSSADQDDEPAF